MRILYINDSLAVWGGLERILVEKVNYLAEKYGYDVYMITCDQGNHIIPYQVSPMVTIIDLDICFFREYNYSGFKRLFIKYKLRSQYRERLKEQLYSIKPNIIVCARLHLMGILNQVKGQIPLVVESHSLCRAYKFEVSGRVKTIIEKLYSYQVRKAQLLVALTYGDANDWMKITRNVVVIPNFVHLNNSGKYSDLKSKKALFVGRFSKQKDIGILFKIWEVVNQKHSDWQLHIYGGYGDDYEQLMYKYKKTSSCVIIHEPTPMIFDAYLNSSMLLLTSVYEPFGLVLPEAMSCGLPVISFNCPYGPSDIIKDGIDGFLVKERNVLEYANRVCQLIENSSLRTRMGQAAAVTSQRYRADLIMPIWKQLFEKL